MGTVSMLEDDSNLFKILDDAEEQKKMNATYIISIARKLGCSIFLLPEDIIEVIVHFYAIVSMLLFYFC